MSITYGTPGRVSFGWITESWQLFSSQAGIWIVAMLALVAPTALFGAAFYIYLLVNMFPAGFPPPAPVPGAAPFPTPGTNPFFTNSSMTEPILIWEGVFGVTMLLYYSFLYGGLFQMAVNQVRGLSIAYRDIFSGGRLFGRMLGAMLLLGLAGYATELIAVGPGLLRLWLSPHAMTAIIAAFVFGILILMCLGLILWGLLLPAFALMADGEPIFGALRRSVRGMKAQWLPAAGFVFVLGLLVYASEIPCGIGLLATIPMVFLICALAYRDLVGMPNMAPPPVPGYAPAAPGVWPPPPGPQ